MLVGTDQNGNRYYRIGNSRKVEYESYPDPENIDSSWYLWLHGVVDEVENVEKVAVPCDPKQKIYNREDVSKDFSVTDYKPWKPRDCLLYTSDAADD